MASAVQSETAGFAFDGRPLFADVPSKLPFASKGLVAGCISRKNATMIQSNSKALHEC